MMQNLSLETQDQKWEVARTWLKECTEGHSVCSNYGEVEKDDSFFYPTRLVDIGPGPDLRPRLRESYSLPPGTRYMTLSHCWGKLKILRLLENNIEDLEARDRHVSFMRDLFGRHGGDEDAWRALLMDR
jgi:hypothetical protein